VFDGIDSFTAPAVAFLADGLRRGLQVGFVSNQGLD
jgi:hypothetical protein